MIYAECKQKKSLMLIKKRETGKYDRDSYALSVHGKLMNF